LISSPPYPFSELFSLTQRTLYLLFVGERDCFLPPFFFFLPPFSCPASFIMTINRVAFTDASLWFPPFLPQSASLFPFSRLKSHTRILIAALFFNSPDFFLLYKQPGRSLPIDSLLVPIAVRLSLFFPPRSSRNDCRWEASASSPPLAFTFCIFTLSWVSSRCLAQAAPPSAAGDSPPPPQNNLSPCREKKERSLRLFFPLLRA